MRAISAAVEVSCAIGAIARRAIMTPKSKRERRPSEHAQQQQQLDPGDVRIQRTQGLAELHVDGPELPFGAFVRFHDRHPAPVRDAISVDHVCFFVERKRVERSQVGSMMRRFGQHFAGGFVDDPDHGIAPDERGQFAKIGIGPEERVGEARRDQHAQLVGQPVSGRFELAVELGAQPVDGQASRRRWRTRTGSRASGAPRRLPTACGWATGKRPAGRSSRSAASAP